MRRIFLLCITICMLLPNASGACTMYKLTQNGKTIVGNNEDWTSPNGQFWFEKGSKDTFGVMYMGFLNNFAQGAINDQGLMFDGFWEPYLAVNDVAGKLEIPIEIAIQKVMQTMTTVEEVQTYLETVNLTILENGQLVFVDASGTYLIIEGDQMFLGEENEKTFSNFYYSQIDSLEEVNLPYFKKGQDFIKNNTNENGLTHCSLAMEEFSQNNIAPTQYTTVYDLENLTIRVYLFHDFESFVELNLTKELQKGNHRTMIAELFPKDSNGYKHYKKYNNPERPTLLLEELVGDQEFSEQEYLEFGFEGIITSLGYEWLDHINNSSAAIKVFQYGVSLMPTRSSMHFGLGEAYTKNKEWDKAVKHLTKVTALDPSSTKAPEMLEEIRKLRTTTKK